MDFIGTNELNKAQIQAKAKLKNKLPKIRNIISNNMDTNNTKTALKESNKALKDITYNTFHTTFNKYYPDGYSYAKLDDSLMPSIDSDFNPHLKYNVIDVGGYNNFNLNSKKFNPNIKSVYDEKLGFESLGAISEGFIGLDSELDVDAEHYADMDQDILQEAMQFNKQHDIVIPKEIYKEAEIEALKAYYKYWKNVLYPKFRNVNTSINKIK